METAAVVPCFGGTFAAFAILSRALSVSVRVRTAEFDRRPRGGSPIEWETALWWPRATWDERSSNRLPSALFHLHEFHSVWGTWIQYYTGR